MFWNLFSSKPGSKGDALAVQSDGCWPVCACLFFGIKNLTERRILDQATDSDLCDHVVEGARRGTSGNSDNSASASAAGALAVASGERNELRP